MGRDAEQHRPPTPPEPRPSQDDLTSGDPELGFPVSPVRPPIADRGLSIAAGIVALVIGLAVVKPWAPASTAAPAPQPPRQVPAQAGPTPAPTPRPTDDAAAALASPVCLGTGAWRIASLETWQDQDVRVWRAVEPIADATGPLDPAVPTVPVVGLEIRALGWCAPVYGPQRPTGPAVVQGWIVIDGVAYDLELRQVLPERGATSLAALYQPVAPCALGVTCAPGQTRLVAQRWEMGRVVFRYEDQDATTAWFGADVVLYVPAERPAASSVPSPAG